MPARYAKSHPWLFYAFAILATVAFLVGMVGLANSVNDQRKTDHHICLAVNNIDKIIQAQLRRSLTNIPKIMYYKQHPDELRTQLGQVREEIVAFRPQRCK
jgi:hypothetical protein